jgi:hypothetical protein
MIAAENKQNRGADDLSPSQRRFYTMLRQVILNLNSYLEAELGIPPKRCQNCGERTK